MYAELHEYLLLYQELPMPGLGTFQVKRHPSVVDFPNRLIQGPGYSIEWQESVNGSPDKLWSWLAANAHISVHEARHQLDKFIFQLKNSLAAGDTIHWNGVGELRKEAGKTLSLHTGDVWREGSVPAHKVIREKAEHMVKVGEEERTSEQMTAFFSERKKRVFSSWKIAAAILLVLSASFLAWYFSQHGWDMGAGNRQMIQPAAATEPTYHSLP